jgi:hypothetical protein
MTGAKFARGAISLAAVLSIGSLAGGIAAEGTGSTMTRRIEVERFSGVSSKAFDDVIAAVEAKIGHPDMSALPRRITAALNEAELKKAVQSAVGPSRIMEFARYDLGEVLQRENGTKGPRIVRLVMGNPLIMKEMVKYVPDAGSSRR